MTKNATPCLCPMTDGSYPIMRMGASVARCHSCDCPKPVDAAAVAQETLWKQYPHLRPKEGKGKGKGKGEKEKGKGKGKDASATNTSKGNGKAKGNDGKAGQDQTKGKGKGKGKDNPSPRNPSQTQPQLKNAQVLDKHNYGPKADPIDKTQGNGVDNGSSHEVVCSDCGKLHNNPKSYVGHWCSERRSKTAPCAGVMVLVGQEEEGEEEQEDAEESGYPVPRDPNKKDTALFVKHKIGSHVKEQPTKQQAAGEEGKHQTRREELERELEENAAKETPSAILAEVLQKDLDDLPKAKKAAAAEQPREDEPQAAEKEAAKLRLAKHTRMEAMKVWEEDFAKKVKDVKTKRDELNKELEALESHGKKVREGNGTEMASLNGCIQTLTLVAKSGEDQSTKFAGMDRDALSGLWKKNEKIKAAFSTEQQDLIGEQFGEMLLAAVHLTNVKEQFR